VSLLNKDGWESIPTFEALTKEIKGALKWTTDFSLKCDSADDALVETAFRAVAREGMEVEVKRESDALKGAGIGLLGGAGVAGAAIGLTCIAVTPPGWIILTVVLAAALIGALVGAVMGKQNRVLRVSIRAIQGGVRYDLQVATRA